MHILIATPCLPWPLNEGGKVAQFSTLECLSEDHSFTIVCPTYSQAETERIKEIEQRLSNVRVREVPLYDNSDPINQSRLYVFLNRKFNRVCHFLSRKLNSINLLIRLDEKHKLEAITNHPYYPFTPLPISFIKALGEEMRANVDLLQVEFSDMLSLSVLKLPNIPKIFINHQIHWVYAERHVKIHGSDPYSNYLENLILSQETIFLSEFDSIVVFSEADAKKMSSVVDTNKIHISPFPLLGGIDSTAIVQKKVLKRENFTFIGSEGHGPNQDAVEWLLLDIWPLIRASLPQAQLFIIGNWGQEWCSTHQLEGVVYTGFVDDIAQIMQGTIHLVPVRIGSGIRTKILTAMALEIPVISTTIGIEGIEVCDFEHTLIRDTAYEFAMGAINLATDSQLASDLASKALKFVRNNYSPEVVRKTRNAIYEKVMLSALIV